MAIIFIHIVKRLVAALGSIASGLLILLVLLMCYNVIARYAFSASSIGLEELTWHAYAAIFLLGIPYALQSGAHVRVDLIFEKMSPRNQQLVDLAGTALFLIPTCLVIIYSGWQFTSAAYQLGHQPDSVGQFFSQLVSSGIGERSQDPGGLLNRWIIKAIIPLSFLFLLLAAIASLMEKWIEFRLGADQGKEA
ncbi:MAG: TRAP-type mannitol/chloroaromatic compound transport system permease small subunit [Arenicella sp.]|jgi:TRAP-type mannitol/chloroaromatic compound transport system permease small subunit